jgi:hypothetical protein
MVMKQIQNVRVRTGREGPKHDPYSYTEITVTRLNGNVITMHSGLMTWLKFNGVPVQIDGPDWEKELFIAFEKLSGMSFEYAESVPHILEARYVRSLSQQDRWSYWMMKEADEQMLRWAM